MEVGACLTIAVLMLCFAWKKDGWIQFVLLWISLAMVAGPFAPLSCTGGDCRVGVGETLTLDTEGDASDKEETKYAKNNVLGRKSRAREVLLLSQPDFDSDQKTSSNDVMEEDSCENVGVDNGAVLDANTNMAAPVSAGADEWTSADLDLLKKLMVKHPRGKLQRWEVIAEGFNGRHSVESIVKVSKDLGQRNRNDGDSYSQFLAKRKTSSKDIDSPLSQRWDVEEALSDKDVASGDRKQSDIARTDVLTSSNEKKKKDWTEAEDKALLNALKTFPKDAPMRWEKVALAVPGRTKPQCFRRFSELRDSFRNKQLEKGSKLQTEAEE